MYRVHYGLCASVCVIACVSVCVFFQFSGHGSTLADFLQSNVLSVLYHPLAMVVVVVVVMVAAVVSAWVKVGVM